MGEIMDVLGQLNIEIDEQMRASLAATPELAPYNLCFEPLSLETFFILCDLLLYKDGQLPC